MAYNSLCLGCLYLENFSKFLVLLYLLGLTLVFFHFFLVSSIQGLLAPVDCLISHSLCHHVITPAEELLLKQQPQKQNVVLKRHVLQRVTSNTIMMPPAFIFEVVSKVV